MSRRRVFLHVGTPKSGTSYLQDKLALNRDRLERHGLCYVRTRTGDHFEAALDLIEEPWAGEEKTAAGQWESLVLESRKAARGDLLVSHEILAAAGPASVARAIESFPDHEVHVVLTARDLGRQVPAEWQEQVKHRAGRSYTEFMKGLHRSYTRTDSTTWFWRVQHVPRILETWGHGLPPAHVHLVTVPPSTAPRDVLWKRFAGVVGLSPRTSYAESETVNASLGGAEVTLLRRLNLELRKRKVPRDTYVAWVRETIVKEVLAARPDKVPATVPPGRRPSVEQITASWLETIRESGIDVVGDLADLEPVWPDHSDHWPNPDHAEDRLVADAAIESLAHVLDRLGTSTATERELSGPVARITRRFRG